MHDYLEASMRHFAELRDGDHGGATSRAAKEEVFETATALLDPYAYQVLTEVNTGPLLGTGEITATGVTRLTAGGLAAYWSLSWPEQRTADVQPIALVAYFGQSFHHPHLMGGTVGEWPLNVFSATDAEAEVPTLRAIAVADLHNLVFRRDFRLVPAMRHR